MAVLSGTGIVQDGLWFAYDAANTVRSWKGCPTENIAYSSFFSGNGNFTTNTTIQDTLPDGSIGNVRLLNADYVYDANRTVSVGVHTLAAGETYTLSFYVKNINCSGFSGNVYSTTLAQSIKGITYPSISTDEWTRVIITFTVPDTGPTDVSVSPQAFRDGGYGYFKMCWLQLEKQPFATPFTQSQFRYTGGALLEQIYGRTITLQSDVVYNTDGTFGFDGTAFTSYASIPTLNLNNQSYTVEAWFKANTIDRLQGLIADLQYGWWNFYVSAGNKVSVAYRDGSSTTRGCYGTTSISVDTWYHAAITYDLPSTTTRVYLNGEQDAVNSSSPVFELANRGPQFIGHYRGGAPTAANVLDGQIPAMRVYRGKALSATEVKQNYLATRPQYVA